MGKSLFILIFILTSIGLNAQLHDLRQRDLLKSLSIDKIEKTQVVFDDSGSPIVGTIKNIEVINKEGFIINRTVLDEAGKVKTMYKFNYKNDTLLLESIYEVFRDSEIKNVVTKYIYDDNNRVKQCQFIDGGHVSSKLKYCYSKDGSLKKIKQTWFSDSTIGSYGGKGTTKYTYNSNRQLSTLEIKKKHGKKIEKKTYEYEYKNNILVNTFLTSKGDKKRSLSEKLEYDPQRRIDSKFFFMKDMMIYHIGKRKVKLKAGESKQTVFQYNDDGLISNESTIIDDHIVCVLKYDYSSKQ